MNQKQAALLGREIMLLGTYEEYDVETLINILKHADDMYYNGDGSFLSDEDYDALRRYTQHQEPHHSYFTGIGSEVRGGKVKLPVTLGSLDQIEYGEIEKWIKTLSLQNEQLTITEKLDGISLLLVYDNRGMFQIAFTRGDGVRGADASRHARRIPSIPKYVKDMKLIRGELIIRKQNWDRVTDMVTSKTGTPYKNARNCIAGLINSKEINQHIYPLIDFVAYEVLK